MASRRLWLRGLWAFQGHLEYNVRNRLGFETFVERMLAT